MKSGNIYLFATSSECVSCGYSLTCVLCCAFTELLCSGLISLSLFVPVFSVCPAVEIGAGSFGGLLPKAGLLCVDSAVLGLRLGQGSKAGHLNRLNSAD